ncbi:NADP-dependent oxidoreductase domain-containing protein [Schizophyllum amplum]|uniref:NADP-dependent oxidoreductase domain-containing protein n=1 Tax=Schizophyllum amplum TaxID=97359 RepID=A0A550CCP6_9AGAR|nr:NADP-dependent oxidoreductase domain-containing protein [Auriculariopsis ampla]
MSTKTYTLSNGKHIPWIGFGTGTAFYGQDASGPVKQAIANGFTHLDGAQSYDNEESIGAAIKASGKQRLDLFITTKLSPNFTLAPGESLKASLEGSLKKIGTDYVDLFLVHSPLAFRKDGTLPALWVAMEGLVKDGLARSIGVSNFKVEDLEAVLAEASIPPAVNQIELHPYVWRSAKSIYDLCKAKGITVASYNGLSPLTKGKGGPLDGILEDIAGRLSKDYGKTVTTGQVLQKWLIQKEVIVITTTSKAERIHEYLDAINVPDLTSDEIAKIEENGVKVLKRVYMKNAFAEGE